MPFVEEIKEASNGRIITVHPGGSITTGTTAIDDVTSGAVDMIWTLQGYTAGRFPLTEMLEFFDHFNSAVEATETIWGLFEQSEAFREEYSDYKVFNMYVTDIGDVYTSNKPIHTPADLNGVKLRAPAPWSTVHWPNSERQQPVCRCPTLMTTLRGRCRWIRHRCFGYSHL